MKLSSVAISASALAMTASAAIVPIHANSILGTAHSESHDHRDHNAKASNINLDPVSSVAGTKLRKREVRRSRIRSTVYLDSIRHNHDHNVVMTSYRGHGHDVVEVPVHGHSIEYMEAGRLHRDHKRSKYYSYLPNAPYAYDVPAVTVVRGSRPHYVQPAMVVDGSSPVTVIKGNGHGHDNVNVHEHVHYRRKSQHGASKMGSPKRFSIKHGKPSQSQSNQGDKESMQSEKHQGQQKRPAAEADAAEKTPVHKGAKKSEKSTSSSKSKHISERSVSTSTSVTQSGVPGFVEVATPVFKSALAKTVSGLAYSTSASNGTGFDLGTSDDQSTQFFMSPVNGTNGQVVYQLRIPILDSKSFKTVDHCATFAISPPGPLSLQKCGPVPGSSQIFSYDPPTGQLQPIYGLGLIKPDGTPVSSPASSAPMASGVPALGTYRQTKSDTVTNGTSNSSSNSTAPSNATVSQNSTSMIFQNSTESASTASHNGSSGSPVSSTSGNVTSGNMTSNTYNFLAQPTPSSQNSTKSTNSSSATSSDDEDGTAASVVLYFVPAEGFYQAPATIDQILNATDSTSPMTPSPKSRNVISSDDDEDDDDKSDASVRGPQSSDPDYGLDRAVIDPVTNAASAAGAPPLPIPNYHSGVNTEQVLGDGGNAGEDLAETQEEAKNDEAEDSALIAPMPSDVPATPSASPSPPGSE